MDGARYCCFRGNGGTEEDITGRLGLAEKSLRTALEVLSMRAQYFRDITEQGVEAGRQLAYLVEQGHEAVFSESHRTARVALTSELEIEAAKQLAKARLESEGGRTQTGGQGSAHDE